MLDHNGHDGHKGKIYWPYLCVLCVLCGGSAPHPRFLTRTAPSPATALTITAIARSVQPGEVVVLTIDTTARAGTLRVRAFNHDMPALRVSPLRWRALVGIDLGVTPGRYPIAVDAHEDAKVARATHVLVVQPRRFPTRRVKVDEGFVNPPPSVSERIAREARDLQELWRHSPRESRWSDGFVRPVPNPANSRFGTRSIYNGQPRSQHGGADFLSPAGTPVQAPNAAQVVLARDLYFLGNTVVLDHGQGLFSILAHLSAIDVHQGESVAAGKIVGRVGATGRVTGPHLHWAVRLADARVDPLAVVELLEK
jgi:murein DD-endopeptidase MepM/ murein hydrolase activator NlpD